MVMNSMILYYRYLFVAIGPLLFAIAAVLSHVRTKPLVAGVVAVTLAATVMNQALLVRDDYDQANDVPVQQFRETVDRVADQNGGQSPLVVSTDIGYMGVTSVMCPDIPQTYMDWQKGNWDRAFMAYSPTLVSKMSWEIIFNNFHGTFICLGQAQNDSLPRDISDLSQKDGFNLGEIPHLLSSLRAHLDDHRRDDQVVGERRCEARAIAARAFVIMVRWNRC